MSQGVELQWGWKIALVKWHVPVPKERIARGSIAEEPSVGWMEMGGEETHARECMTRPRPQLDLGLEARG